MYSLNVLYKNEINKHKNKQNYFLSYLPDRFLRQTFIEESWLQDYH